MLGLLRVVPVWAWVLVAALAWGGIQKARATHAAGKLAQQQVSAERARGDALHAGVIEINRRLAAQQEAANAAQTQARRARADAAAAGAAAGRLRDYAVELAARAGACDPAAAAVGPAASAPGVVLADMLGRLEARGRELAEEADRRGNAGSECAARYDALTPPTNR